ncbi:hypothetical protein OJ998_01780 [Solirubrobacter taibaiensis]|nr:hypothetical protein [Solirubrobacter taibaiensis]
MTDLPQLQTNLVDAATRQRRRRRVRRVTVRVAVAATLLVAFPLLAREIAAPDPEVIAPTPTPTATAGPPKTVEEAFAVFRRPATARDTPPWLAAGDEARFIGGPKAHPVYLVKRGDELCLAVRNTQQPMVCNLARAFVSGEALLVRARGNLLTVALPDAVRTVRITTPGFKPFTLEAADALAVTLGSRSTRLEWVAPDGTPRADHLYGRDAAAHWGRFWDAERPADHLDDLPGARRIVSDRKVDAWLVPRRNAVCLVVRSGNDQNSGCRRNLGNSSFPIVVSVEHRIVAAFPDRLRPLSVEPPSRHSNQSNALLIRDGDDAVTFTYRDTAGVREVRLPDQKDFVLNADPMSPLDLMPE